MRERFAVIVVLIALIELWYSTPRSQDSVFRPGQVFTVLSGALPGTCSLGQVVLKTTATIGLYFCTATNVWTQAEWSGPLSEAVPSGAILLVDSGACPSNYTEQTGLNGRMLLGTLNANANVGTTGGADSITPAGTNSGGAVSAHSGTAVAAHASHTHTYTDVIAHTHIITSQTATTGTAGSYEHGTFDLSSTENETSEDTGETGIPVGTSAGPSATLTHAVTQPSAHTFTQPTFTGTPFSNTSAFTRVIFCQKD